MYLVIRHGANSANQHLCPAAPLGIYGHRDRDEAKRLAAAEHTVYANQWLEAIPLSRAPAALVREAVEEAGLKAHYQANCAHDYEHGRCNWCTQVAS